MAGIRDFLKERWTVKTAVPRSLTGLLPAKGCTISFKQDGPKACCMVATSSKPEDSFEGFKLKNGRLEREVPGTNKVVVLELAKPAKGAKGARAKARLKGWLQVDDKAMSGTWGAESGGGGGGGGGNVYPSGAGAGAG
jgi:hypothetical protein